MASNFIKGMALKAVALGVELPQAHLDRFGELVYLRRLLALLQTNCVIDVGANRGQFATELRAIGYTGRIVSFEPIPAEFARMSEAFTDDPNWQGHQLALGSEERTMNLHVPSLTVMSSLLDAYTADKSATSSPVEVRRLDAMFSSLVDGLDNPCVFLKMDTQGYDVEVFKGAAGCIAGIGGLQSELSVQPLYAGMPHYLDALEVYEQAGFELYNVSVVNRVEDGGLLELNCFMKRGDR